MAGKAGRARKARRARRAGKARNGLASVIPSEAKESLCEIAASLKLLAMTMYRSVGDMTLEAIGEEK